MRRKLRPFRTPDELDALYSHPYDHTQWPAHVERVAKTVEVLDAFAGELVRSWSVADLSCGDGAIVDGSQHPWMRNFLHDLSWPRGLRIEDSVHEMGPVDVFVCCETLEHVEDPDRLLKDIRAKSRALVLSTPCGEEGDGDPEHYWGWDLADINAMLAEAGWTDRRGVLFTPPSNDYYTFQIWTCT